MIDSAVRDTGRRGMTPRAQTAVMASAFETTNSARFVRPRSQATAKRTSTIRHAIPIREQIIAQSPPQSDTPADNVAVAAATLVVTAC